MHGYEATSAVAFGAGARCQRLLPPFLFAPFFLGFASPHGRPLGAENKDKPFREALRMEEKELAAGNVIQHPEGSLRWNAQLLLMRGDQAPSRLLAPAGPLASRP
jgi:hypothetical protein